jgi:phage terminase large subunit
VDADAPLKTLNIEIPARFLFLVNTLAPYKVAWGGRNGLKSWSFAHGLLALGAAQKLRIVCGRYVMKSLADSVHKTLSDRIEGLGIGNFYRILENQIRGGNGTTISYVGLNEYTAQSIRSLEGTDIFWAEEAEDIPEAVWQILLPTIRAGNSETWVSFNPGMESSSTFQRWVVNPPPGTIVVKSTYEYAKSCGFFTEKMEQLRVHDEKILPPDEYANIWLGMPRTAVAGAIYAREMSEMIEEGRIRPIPYDPRLPVHTIWDLGWNDAMSIIMVQKPHPSALNVINYLEDNYRRYDEYVAELSRLRYNWGTDWLPFDAKQTHPESGLNAYTILQKLGRNVRLINEGKQPDPEAGIRAARMMFPRVYIDNTARKCHTGFLGAARLIDCLKHSRRRVPKTTMEPGDEVHDEYSHASAAWRGLATIVDQIRNEGDREMVTLPAWRNVDPSMGMLG